MNSRYFVMVLDSLDIFWIPRFFFHLRASGFASSERSRARAQSWV